MASRMRLVLCASAVALTTSLAADALRPLDAWTLPLNAFLFAAAYALCWLVTPGGRALIRENLTLVRLLHQNA